VLTLPGIDMHVITAGVCQNTGVERPTPATTITLTNLYSIWTVITANSRKIASKTPSVAVTADYCGLLSRVKYKQCTL